MLFRGITLELKEMFDINGDKSVDLTGDFELFTACCKSKWTKFHNLWCNYPLDQFFAAISPFLRPSTVLVSAPFQ
jgi:hypothetical protein